MALPPANKQLHGREAGLELGGKVLNKREEDLVLTAGDQHGIDLEPMIPVGRRQRQIGVVIPLGRAQIRAGPRLGHMLGDQVAAGVDLLLGEIGIQHRPGSDHDGSPQVFGGVERRDLGVGMGEVRKDAADEVPTGGVAADVDVARGVVGVVEDVTEAFDSLAELGGIGSVRGEGVGQAEDGNRLAGLVHVGDDVVEEVEVAHVGGEGESSSCWS